MTSFSFMKDTCVECYNPLGAERIKKIGYWSGELVGYAHPECAPRFKDHILEQQTIDADCNDCRHFQRGEMKKRPGFTYFLGHCLKFDKPTKAYPVQYTGHPCFEHRRTA